MEIRCQKCGHTEETTLDLLVSIIGGAMPLGGFWAWTTYLFAGTGLAMPIVISIITGGVGLLAFKKQVVKWVMNKRYVCSDCGAIDWAA
ncbi:hypothetical protein JCM16814_34270 [Desulfobaculum senezii]